jgi:protein-disulfide isomerase
MSKLGFAFTLPFVLTTAVGFAAQEASQSASEKSEEDRVTETTESEESQIIEELAKIRKEIQTLRIEVGDLRRKVGDIHRVAVRPAPTPPPAPESVDLDENRALGSADAEVAIVEFSDYQCPYCQRFFLQTFPELEKSYIETGKVRFYFRDFPLERIHPQARAAAIAANCAARQGAYWDMHHGLFENQKKLGSELYEELAKEIGLDIAAFQSCLVEPSESEKVDQELAYGQSLTVQGTPHYFVGRIEEGQLVDVKRVNGAQPIEAFSKVIDALLQ